MITITHEPSAELLLALAVNNETIIDFAAEIEEIIPKIEAIKIKQAKARIIGDSTIAELQAALAEIP